MKREPNISEQEAREIVEKMGRRESYDPKFMDDFYRSIGLKPDKPEQPCKTVTEEAETAMVDEPSDSVPGETAVPRKRISGKQRRLSLEEYRSTYLQVVNGNRECSIFGKIECSVFRNSSTSFSVTMMQHFL